MIFFCYLNFRSATTNMLILLRDRNQTGTRKAEKISVSHFYDFLMKNHFNLIISIECENRVLWKFIRRHYEAIRRHNAIKSSSLSPPAVDLTWNFLSLIFQSILRVFPSTILIKRRKKKLISCHFFWLRWRYVVSSFNFDDLWCAQ